MTYRFRKLFNARSVLVGLEIVDSLTFVNRDCAAAWLRGVRRNVRAGRLPYSIRLVK